MLNIATWNLCLGLKNKKDTVYGCLIEENIDIAFLQEVDIRKEYPIEVLTNKEYRLEVETSNIKSRCAIAIKNNINYKRRTDLEGEDLSLVIIDVTSTTNYRLINIYHQFHPPQQHIAYRPLWFSVKKMRTCSKKSQWWKINNMWGF